VQRRRIGEILVDRGLVTKDHVDEALRIQQKTKETLGAILVDMGCITEMDITKTIVMQYQLPYIDLANYQVNDKLVEMFDVNYLHQHKIVPFDQIGDMLLCAVAEVPRDEVLGEIPKTTQRNVALYVAPLTDVTKHLARLAPLHKETGSDKAVKRPADESKPKKIAAAATAGAARGDGNTQIFEEESSEAILEALDSTWDSIFENVDSQSDDDDGMSDNDDQSLE
jgi:hypothetical protein